MNDNERIDGLSLDTAAVTQEKLRALFPQCFVEGKLDERRLLALLGSFETLDANDRERYEFRWKGKQECLQLAGKRSAGTLRPCRAESVDWENTRNLYIEGDNLEVLKLLQTAYFRKVKMIYIEIITSRLIQFDDYKNLLSGGVQNTPRGVHFQVGVCIAPKSNRQAA
jgi:adenine-specific DNA-methyltransferase